MPKKIEISHRTILFTFFVLGFLWFVFRIRQIILLVYIASILMAALRPLIDRLEKLKIPRALGIIFCYFVVLGLLGLILSSLFPSLIEQTKRLLDRLSFLLTTFDISQVDQSALSNQLGSLPQKLLKLVASLFSNFLGLFVVLVITFYLLMERKKLGYYLGVLFGEKQGKYLEKVVIEIEEKLGKWVRGQLFLCGVVGVMTYIGLRFLGIDFALSLSLLAAVLEIVPNIGPVLSAVPAILIALVSSPVSALAVVALYFLVQQLENYLIVPSVMRRAVRLSPLIVILSLMVGFQVGGVPGAILAIPTVLILRIIIKEISLSRHL